jgi:hypothetical protein
MTFAALRQPVSETVKSTNSWGGELLASLSLSNQFLAFALGGGSDHNLWERVTFEWTNGSRFISTVDSLARFRTNNLIR